MAIYDVTEAFNDMRVSIVIERETGVYTNGVFVAGAPASSSVLAVVEPVTGSRIELQSLGVNGWDTSKFIKVFYEGNLLVASENERGDYVIYKGDRYIVRDVANWVDIGGFIVGICEYQGEEV